MPDFVEAGHLGGYIEGGDSATEYPLLWSWLADEGGARTVLDVGCGEGHSTRAFRAAGCEVMPIDGVPQPELAHFVQHDYTLGPFDPGSVPPWDLAWCCEVVEHIEERYLPNLLATLRCASAVAMTHAGPGQAGYHHVNCRTADYWCGVMAAEGFHLDHRLTVLTRTLAADNPSPWNHYRRSGLYFTRNT